MTDSKNYKWATTDEATVTLDFEITKATNKWTDDPTISGWTYGETASTPTYKVKFGTVDVIFYTGKTNGDEDYSKNTPPTEAGSYTVTFNVKGNDNYTGLEDTVDFEIKKATYDMLGAKWDYTAAFNYDGKEKTVTVTGLPDGVKVSGYTENKKTVVGNYTAKATLSYDGNNYNTPVVPDLPWSIVNTWQPTEYTVTKLNAGGWINGDFVIAAADGYKVSTTNTADGVWSDKLTYTAETIVGEVTFYLRNANDEISLAKTVNYKLDKTNPTGTVEFVGREPWQEFVNNITFGLFFKDEVTVKTTTNDDVSLVASIEYYTTSAALTQDEVEKITEWTAMPGKGVGVTVEDTKQFVYYIRITDNAGNVTYLSTNGAEYDTTNPKIEGVANGSIYYVTQKVTVTDKNLDLDNITLNGTPVTLDENGSFTLTGNTDTQYKIVATDKAGNETTVTVTMKSISEIKTPINDKTTDNIKSTDGDTVQSVIDDAAKLLTDPDITDSEKAEVEEIKKTAETLKDKIGSAAAESTDITNKVGEYKPESVTSDDKQDIKDLIDRIDTLLDGDNLTEDEKAALEKTKKAAQDLINKIDQVSNALETENTDKTADITSENVKTDNKESLEAAKADLEKALSENASNYTDKETAAIKAEIARIEAALDVIGNVESVEKLIAALSDDIDRKADGDAVAKAKKAYNSLTDYEKSILNSDLKDKLESSVTTIAEQTQLANILTISAISLLALLVILFIIIIIYKKKKKEEQEN